jgi:hypothetical protein
VKPASDVAGRLLAFAVQRMPPARREWGAAMLAELAALQDSPTRWKFALGCAWVAVFPPPTGGPFETMKYTTITAALVSTVLVAPLLYFELRYGYSGFPYFLFAVLWLVPAVFVFAAGPLIRAMRAGQSVLAHPVVLSARVGFLVLAALFWTAIVNDQMPCFLGVPNCD